MKRLLCILLTGAMLFGAACTVAPASPDPEPPTDMPTDVEQPTDAPTAEPTDAPVEPLYASYADFADALAAKLVDGTVNRNLSPISVYLALAMVADGAKGQTLNEMLSLLGCKTLEELRGVCGAMLEALSIDEDGDFYCLAGHALISFLLYFMNAAAIPIRVNAAPGIKYFASIPPFATIAVPSA